MMDQLMSLTISTSGVTVFLLLTVLLFALLRWLRWLLGLVPMSKGRREALNRGILVSETVVVLVFLLTYVPMVFEVNPAYTPIFFGVLILGIVWVSWFVIRDAVAGLFIKAGEIVRLGDTVSFDGARGRITALGVRVLELETSEGEQIIVPYSRLTHQAVTRTAAVDNVIRHSFRLPRAGLDVPATRARVRCVALSHHWSSLAREPQIEIENDALLVTVFALDDVHGPNIESAIREVLQRG